MNNLALDKELMFKAIKEAKRGIPHVYPNPAVGCVIHDGDKIYNAVDVTKNELNTFVEQMTSNQLNLVMEFFEGMPKLRHVIQVTNPKTKKKGEVVVEGLQSFLG